MDEKAFRQAMKKMALDGLPSASRGRNSATNASGDFSSQQSIESILEQLGFDFPVVTVDDLKRFRSFVREQAQQQPHQRASSGRAPDAGSGTRGEAATRPWLTRRLLDGLLHGASLASRDAKSTHSRGGDASSSERSDALAAHPSSETHAERPAGRRDREELGLAFAMACCEVVSVFVNRSICMVVSSTVNAATAAADMAQLTQWWCEYVPLSTGSPWPPVSGESDEHDIGDLPAASTAASHQDVPTATHSEHTHDEFDNDDDSDWEPFESDAASTILAPVAHSPLLSLSAEDVVLRIMDVMSEQPLFPACFVPLVESGSTTLYELLTPFLSSAELIQTVLPRLAAQKVLGDMLALLQRRLVGIVRDTIASFVGFACDRNAPPLSSPEAAVALQRNAQFITAGTLHLVVLFELSTPAKLLTGVMVTPAASLFRMFACIFDFVSTLCERFLSSTASAARASAGSKDAAQKSDDASPEASSNAKGDRSSLARAVYSNLVVACESFGFFIGCTIDFLERQSRLNPQLAAKHSSLLQEIITIIRFLLSDSSLLFPVPALLEYNQRIGKMLLSTGSWRSFTGLLSSSASSTGASSLDLTSRPQLAKVVESLIVQGMSRTPDLFQYSLQLDALAGHFRTLVHTVTVACREWTPSDKQSTVRFHSALTHFSVAYSWALYSRVQNAAENATQELQGFLLDLASKQLPFSLSNALCECIADICALVYSLQLFVQTTEPVRKTFPDFGALLDGLLGKLLAQMDTPGVDEKQPAGEHENAEDELQSREQSKGIARALRASAVMGLQRLLKAASASKCD